MNNALNNPIVVGISAGALSVLIIMISMIGAPVTLPLIFASPLPLMVAGLGWGSSTALVGAAAGVALVGLMTGLVGSAVFAVTTAAGPVWLSRQALAGVGSDQGDTPSGELLIWTSLAAAIAFAVISIWFLQFDGGLLASIASTIPAQSPLLDEMIAQLQASGFELNRAEIIALASAMVPAIMGLTWILAMFANLIGAQAIVTRIGEATRGPFKIATLELPKGYGLILAVLVAAAMVPGNVGFYAGTMAAFFAFPYFLTGIITVHVMSLTWANRNVEKVESYKGLRIGFLVVFYITLLVWGMLPFLVCALGLIDQWRGFRRDALASRQGE